MARLTFVEAIVAAIRDEMRSDERVFMLGQDVGHMGGAMQGAKGLWQEFGPHRVRDAPISESAMVGAGIGAALYGQRPIVEISFGEFVPTAMSQLVLQAANIHYMSGGELRVPLVVRTRFGDGPYRGHPQCFEAWFMHVPGLKVVIPSTPTDAYALMRAAIRDDNPVLFFEHMYLYHALREEIAPPATAPLIGEAAVRRPGRDVTVAATAWMVHKALAAADAVAAEGVDVEVVDLRCLAPLDKQTLFDSLARTNRLVVAHEAWKVGGAGAEVAAMVAEEAFDLLLAPVVRVGAPHIPEPLSQPLRDRFLPQVADIVEAVRRVIQYR